MGRTPEEEGTNKKEGKDPEAILAAMDSTTRSDDALKVSATGPAAGSRPRPRITPKELGLNLVLKNVRGITGDGSSAARGKWGELLRELRDSAYDGALIVEHKIPASEVEAYKDMATLYRFQAVIGGNEQGTHGGGAAILMKE